MGKNIVGFQAAMAIGQWDLLKPFPKRNTIRVDGCWLWANRIPKKGYVKIRFMRNGQRTNFYLHRIVAEAYLGRPLNGEPIHHTCAIRHCLNPKHLQPVSERENIAEMKERQWYIKRIRQLEDQLAQCRCGAPTEKQTVG